MGLPESAPLRIGELWKCRADAATDSWQVVLHEIPGNQTHRYMLLVNGEPAFDKYCDGLAVPSSFEEQQYQLMTPRGPRVFLLFAQTKWRATLFTCRNFHSSRKSWQQ